MSRFRHLLIYKKKRMFEVSPTDAKKFITWVSTFASSLKYSKLRKTLREESVPHEGTRNRSKSQSMLDELHKRFPSMKNCLTDISCFKYLFERAINLSTTTEKNLSDMMLAINTILPLSCPQESQLGRYASNVTDYRNFIKQSKFGEETLKKYYSNLLYAGGSVDREVALAYKIRRDEKSVKSMANSLKFLIPVHEAEIIDAVHQTSKLETAVDGLIFIECMTGARKSELCNRRIASFDFEKSFRDQTHLVQTGVAKDRHNSYGDDDDAMLLRRRVEKVILRLKDHAGNTITPEFVRSAVLKTREMWGMEEMIAECKTDKQIASKHDKALKQRIDELFPRPAAYARKHREKGLSSHFCRKIYINYGWLTLSPETAGQSFAVLNLGWKTLGSFSTSNSYLDLRITLLPPIVPTMTHTQEQLDDWVKYCVKEKQVVLEKQEDDNDDKDLSLIPRVKKLRGLKRNHIDLIHPTTQEVIRIPFHKRRKQTREALVESALNITQLLRDAGEVPTSRLLRSFGLGSDLSKIALN